jgi:heterodisulfide reductase subunit C
LTTVAGFLEEVLEVAGDARLEMCIQCGTCGGSCPSAADMDHTPRELFAMIRANMREEVLRSSTPWYCVSCYYCTVRCPQNIHITDVMYAVKNLAVRAKLYQEIAAEGFSQTFISQVEDFGRSYELGLMARHNLRFRPFQLPGLAPMGIGMVSRGRMDFTPNRIEGLEQLGKILARAKELEAS